MFYLHTIYIIKKKKPYGASLDCSIWFSTYLFKKEMACRYAGPVYWMHSDFADIGEKPLV